MTKIPRMLDGNRTEEPFILSSGRITADWDDVVTFSVRGDWFIKFHPEERRVEVNPAWTAEGAAKEFLRILDGMVIK